MIRHSRYGNGVRLSYGGEILMLLFKGLVQLSKWTYKVLMSEIRFGTNCWTMDIGSCRTLEIGYVVISLIHPKHIYRVWRNKDRKYTKTAWLGIITGLVAYYPHLGGVRG